MEVLYTVVHYQSLTPLFSLLLTSPLSSFPFSPLHLFSPRPVLKQFYTAEYINLEYKCYTIRAYNGNIRWRILLLYHYQRCILLLYYTLVTRPNKTALCSLVPRRINNVGTRLCTSSMRVSKLLNRYGSPFLKPWRSLGQQCNC